jgi:hypothetical protein
MHKLKRSSRENGYESISTDQFYEYTTDSADEETYAFKFLCQTQDASYEMDIVGIADTDTQPGNQ